MKSLWSAFEESWAAFVGGHALWRGWREVSAESHAAVEEVLTAPGKRLRPMLFLLASGGARASADVDVMPAALALEMIHHFILVHDDLLDRSETRRGGASLHHRIHLLERANGREPRRGAGVAMLVGDLLYSMAIESMLGVRGVPAERVGDALRALMGSAVDTGSGALIELQLEGRPLAEVALPAVEDMYARKTGSYSFALPLRVAAALCGWHPDFPFAAFGRAAGIAYQLHNDAEELRRWMEGAPMPDDLRDGRRIWAVVKAWEKGGAAERRRLDAPATDDWKALILDVLPEMESARSAYANEAVGLMAENAPDDGKLRRFVGEMFGV